MIKSLKVKVKNENMLAYSLETLWANKLLKHNKISKEEHAKIIRKIQKKYSKKH